MLQSLDIAMCIRITDTHLLRVKNLKLKQQTKEIHIRLNGMFIATIQIVTNYTPLPVSVHDNYIVGELNKHKYINTLQVT